MLESFTMQVSGASLLAADVKKGANGKPYFIYDVLTRTGGV